MRWEAKGERYIGSIKVKLPARIYVTQAGDLASDVDAEVKVSGSSEDVIKAVNVSALFRTLHVELVTPTNQAIVDQYMLVEVRVRDKDAIFRLESEGNGDVVVLEVVLVSTQATSTPLVLSRRLQGIEDSEQLVLAGVAAPSFLSTTTSSVTTGLHVTEDAFTTASSAAVKDATPLRSWMIGDGYGLDKGGSVNLELSVPGAAVILELTDLERRYPYAGRVMVFGDDATALDQVEVVASGDKLQVHLKSTSGTVPVNGNFTTLVGFSEKCQVTLAETSSSKAAAQVRTDTLDSTMYWEKNGLTITTFGAGNIFVSAPTSLLYVPRITIETYGNGSVQMDVRKAWAAQKTTIRSLSTGAPSLSWFGNILHSAVQTYLSPTTGKLCITTKYPVHGVTVTNSGKDRVAYTGQTELAKVKCEKRVVPERVPTKIQSTNPDEDGTPIESLAVASGESVGGNATPSSSTNSTQDKTASPPTSSSAGAPAAAGIAHWMVCASFAVAATLLL